MNASALLVQGNPNAIALLEKERQISYGELDLLVRQAATAWRALGIVSGDICIIGLLDGIDLVAAFLGLIWIKAIPAAISPRTDAKQLSELLTDSGARILLAEESVVDSLADTPPSTPILSRSSWQAKVSGSAAIVGPPAEANADDTAFMLFSSGTTGKPKGIEHAHRCVEFAQVFAQEVLGATAKDRFFSTSKLFFAYPLANSLFAGLRLGASVVLDPEWPNPQRVSLLVRQHAPTLLFSVPTFYQRLLEADIAFPTVRHFVSAGEACSPALENAWEDKHGRPIVNGYGTTETLMLMLYKLPGMKGLRPTPMSRVREESPDDAEAGVRLWFSHPAVATGYSRVVTHDTAKFSGNEFSPGDLFRRIDCEEGPSWIFAGRSDQLIKVYGRWVDTVALEHWLLEKLQVRELSIVPCETAGSTTCLHLFISAQGMDPDSLPSMVEKACVELSAHKRPAKTHVLSELPRTETGKIRRGILKAMC